MLATVFSVHFSKEIEEDKFPRVYALSMWQGREKIREKEY